jgi:hypothetical protein
VGAALTQQHGKHAALAGAMFQAAALAWVAAKYPSIIQNPLWFKELRARAEAAADAVFEESFDLAIPTDADAIAASRFVDGKLLAAASFSAMEAARAIASSDFASSAAKSAGNSASAARFAADAAQTMWDGVWVDIVSLQRRNASELADSPLWISAAPGWAQVAWNRLRITLPGGEDWEVWINWYEDRLRGGSRGEAYELVFASVPLDVHKEGRAAANAWIRKHLP